MTIRARISNCCLWLAGLGVIALLVALVIFLAASFPM